MGNSRVTNQLISADHTSTVRHACHRAAPPPTLGLGAIVSLPYFHVVHCVTLVAAVSHCRTARALYT